MIEILYKIKTRIWLKLVAFSRKKKYYPLLYRGYWHFLVNKSSPVRDGVNYYTAVPNLGAGIGHQMANWIAGYWFSQQFGLQFAHTPFSSSSWDKFLGFGEKEKNIADLLNNGYTKVRLPIFKESNKTEVQLQKKIIASYSNKKVIFVAEQDQFYKDQFGVMYMIQDKFHSTSAREQDKLIYDTNNFNIAIHVRRGDIVIGQENQNSNLQMRWQGNDYFEKVLANVLRTLKTDKPISIHLFSQGLPSGFPEFDKFSNLHFCLDMNAQDSFLHMVFADLLITSKSSFSYKPALLNRGKKVCPKVFWHGYPTAKDWVLVDNDGNFKGSIN